MQFESIVRVVEMAGGAFLTGLFNDTLVAPALENAIPPLQTDHTLSKAADTGTTVASAWGLGRLGHLVSPRLGTALESGGYILAGMKALAIAIPGVEVKTTVPSPLSLFRASTALAPANGSGAGKGSTAQVKRGANDAPLLTTVAGADATQTGGFSAAGSGTFLNVPKPADQSLDVGL